MQGLYDTSEVFGAAHFEKPLSLMSPRDEMQDFVNGQRLRVIGLSPVVDILAHVDKGAHVVLSESCHTVVT
eukprot:3676110-Karenia_brevis.AAC.1